MGSLRIPRPQTRRPGNFHGAEVAQIEGGDSLGLDTFRYRNDDGVHKA
jgi:hypothetical protein